MPDPTPDLTATLERVNELAEWMDDGDETFIMRMSERMRAAADLRALCTEIRALRHTVKYETDVAEQAISEVRALRADKARLDWLEARARKDESVEVGWSPAGFESDEYGGSRSSWPGGYYAVACDADGLYDHESLRAALDAAREAR